MWVSNSIAKLWPVSHKTLRLCPIFCSGQMFIWGQAWLTLWSFTESPLFGVPLATLLENDQKLKPSTSIPLLLQEVRTLKNICGMCPKQYTYCLCILCSIYDVYDSNLLITQTSQTSSNQNQKTGPVSSASETLWPHPVCSSSYWV